MDDAARPGRDPDRFDRSLEELEELVDQVILYSDPSYLDESKLDTPEARAFARQCREVADFLGSLATRLEGLLGRAPDSPAGLDLTEPPAE